MDGMATRSGRVLSLDTGQNNPGHKSQSKAANNAMYQTVTSITPAVSPRLSRLSPFPQNNGLLLDDPYHQTPLGEGAGTRLMSSPSNIPPISYLSTANEITKHLDLLSSHIADFGRFQDTESSMTIRYKKLSSCVSNAKLIAEQHFPGIMSLKCDELTQKLEDLRVKWRIRQSSSSSFHGFDMDASRVEKTPSSADFNALVKRVSEMETVTTTVRHMRTTFPQLSERISILENHQPLNATDNPEALITEDQMANLECRINDIENQCANALVSMESVAEIRRQVASLLKEFTDFKNSAVSNERITAVEGTIPTVAKNVTTLIGHENELQQKDIQIKTLMTELKNLQSQTRMMANTQQTFYEMFSSFRTSTINDVNLIKADIEHLNTLSATFSSGNQSHNTDTSVQANDFTSIQVPESHQQPSGNEPTGMRDQQSDMSRNQAEVISPSYFRGERRGYNPFLDNPVDPQIERETDQTVNNPVGNNSGDEHSISASTSTTALDLQGKIVWRQAQGLKKLLTPEPSASLSRSSLQDVYKNHLKTVENEKKDIQKALQNYLQQPRCDVDLCERINHALEDSAKWISEIKNLYQSNGYHLKSQSSKLYETLEKYSQQSQIGIFEFISRYEAYTKDFEIEAERAELLYSKFLSSNIQVEVIKYKSDYSALKAALLHRYGDFKTITSNMLLPLSKEKKPTSISSVTAHLNYYRKMQFALQNVNKLLSAPEIPIEEAESYLYSQDFLELLLGYTPLEAKNEFIRRMQQLDQDTIRIKGKVAFKLILAAVNQIYDMYDTSARTDSTIPVPPEQPKNKPKVMKALHASNANNDTNSDSDCESDQELFRSSVNFQTKDVKKTPKVRPICSEKFPCMVPDHNHSIGSCQDFFSLSPKERVENRRSFKFKQCLVCCQSSDECQQRKCANLKKVPSVLVCKECKDLSFKGKKRALYSIFFCLSEKHSKPENEEILGALEKYIPDFKASFLKNPVKLAAHFQILHGLKITQSKPKSKSRPTDVNEPVPAFNTSTGNYEHPQNVDVVKESNEDCIGVMQILNIRGKQVLTLFDRGANQNLIDGKIAEDAKIKVKNGEPSPIGVISGGKIWTDYGMYEMYLGPTEDGKYFEIVAQGISAVTGVFPKYNLENVNTEILTATDLPSDTLLPNFTGGDKIGLLLGLKNSLLEPVCVFSLPSGMGLYKSPFKDIFGSYYCYGGPNSVFSAANKKFHGNVNHFQVYFTQMLNQYKNSLYPALSMSLEPDIYHDESGLSYYKDKQVNYSFQSPSGQDVYPTPLTSQDFTELGQWVEDESSRDVDACPRPHCICIATSTVYKAQVPLSRQRSFLDEPDVNTADSFRCSKCMRCKCVSSNRTKVISLNETVEQEAIMKSVSINLEEKRVYVDLPFIKPPVPFLSERHGGDNNYNQALKVYKSQCRQSEIMKDGIRKVHADLVSKGFMKKLSDLPLEHQELVKKNGFQHYMPWRTVRKESNSTPIRLVVDPSMSGLNLILAKGENRMKRINDILLRARTKKIIWSSDISKLYNRLHLKPSSYAYQLFLFDESLSATTEPEIYVMVVAWYGVASSGNQSIYALEELSSILRDKYPLAHSVITDDTFVDDILSGVNSMEECDDQIYQVQQVLDAGGFQTKFVVISGLPSDEGDSLKVLGYKWNVVSDTLSPGFAEVNFNKKIRGMKSPNPFPVVSPDDVTKLLSSKNVTRRMVISKIAELWEPAGLWEPYKLQLKLASQSLNGIDWDVPLPQEKQEFWLGKFQEFLTIPELSIKRCILPTEQADQVRIRLLCLSDAAEHAGGAAIYAGTQLPDGSFSCQLLTSKSKLMAGAIPRNELEALRIGANLTYDVKTALGDIVEEVLFFTDSSIAMSWCHNTNKKLRLFCLNRVAEIRQLINSITGNPDNLPLYHVDGKLNLADMLTKVADTKPSDLHSASDWICGYPWMKEHLSKMPVTSFSSIQLSATQKQAYNQEYFPEIVLPSMLNQKTSSEYHCKGCMYLKDPLAMECYGTSPDSPHCVQCKCDIESHFFACHAAKGLPMLLDIIKYGWQKSIRIIGRVIEFIWNLKHKIHQRNHKISDECPKCKTSARVSGIPCEYYKVLDQESQDYFFRWESNRLLSTLPQKKTSEYKLKNGILYAVGRVPEDAMVTQKDLDFSVFFDGAQIKGVLPVVSADSDVFFALVLHIHHKVRKHAGVEGTMREVMNKVYPINNPKRIVQAVRKNCSRCRIIARKTLELEMGNHPDARTEFTPAFYNCMCDVAYGFQAKPHKNSRTHLKIYALVIVCLLTSATSILALEGLETQDIVMALERHSARYGIPSTIFVDQGTQLLNLDRVSANLRDANAQLRESIGLQIIPSAAKSHVERGRVERKIRTLREMLKKTVDANDVSMTPLQWETVFAKVSSQIDDIPMARADKGSTANDLGWEILTPNRFKLGCANNRSIEGPMTITENFSPTNLLRKIHDIQRYWYQLLLDRLHHLIPKPKMWTSTDDVNVGDIVIFRFKEGMSAKQEVWKLGRVDEALSGGRRLSIVYSCKNSTRSLIRSPRDVCVVSSVSDLDLNSREFFDRICKIK